MENYSQPKMNIKLTYPYSKDFEYDTSLERINLDEERISDLRTGKGFLLRSSYSIKSDIKNQLGIFSNRFGSTINDVDSFNGKYRCKCGYLKGSIMHGETCPICHTMVKYYDDDISIFGWLILKKHYIIHPNIYKALEAFIGASKMAHIIEPDVKMDSDGRIIAIGSPNTKKNEPFKGIGMIAFKERYREILDYYLSKTPAKQQQYDSLIENIPITFIQSIPVFSALLRPYAVDVGNILRYQTVNDYFMMLSKLVNEINRDDLYIDNKLKEKLMLLNDAQVQFNSVYEEIKEYLSKKRGDVRACIGGRYAFTSRSVISQDPFLKINQIRLPFAGLLELYQQVIINILVKTTNVSYSDAYRQWYRALVRNQDKTIDLILKGLIHDTGGLDTLIGRNPIMCRRYYGNIVLITALNCLG